MKDIDRLLHAAARTKDETRLEMPFGFDTRVIALSRQRRNGNSLARFLRRVAFAATAIFVLASAGAYLELNRDGELIADSGNEFAIADSAIQDEVAQ
jgi:hypothetical protein